MSGGGDEGGGGKRRTSAEEPEEHENHERWLVSYADMMTLLMVLFVVLFAVSQVDVKKFAALKDGLTVGFGSPVAILTGGDNLLSVGGAITPDLPNLNGSTNATAQNSSEISPEKVAEVANATQKAAVAQEVKNLQKVQKDLQAALTKAGMPNGATFRFTERGLVVTIATDKVLFDSGSADLLPAGRRLLDALTPALAKQPNRLSVDGHTNSIPIKTARFPSNWELSTERATGVLRYLMRAVPPTRMSATGFADTHPLRPGGDATALRVNRRVEIIVLANLDGSAGRAVAALGNAKAPVSSSSSASPAPAVSPSAGDWTAPGWAVP